MKIFKLKLLLVIFFSICNAKVVFELNTSEICEVINGIKYISIEKIENGQRSEKYYINGQETLSNEYISSQATSRLKEFENDAQRAKEEREKKFKFNSDAKLKTLKKLIYLKIQEIKENFYKLEKLNILSFFMYSKETFINEEEFNNLKESIEDTDQLISSNADLFITDLDNVYNKLENKAKKTEIFVRQSIENAINKCDDTKLLKDLLNVI